MIVDRLIGVSGAWACKGAGSREIILGLDQWVRDRGVPRVLCVDFAQATRSHELKKWCQERGITQEFSPPYHHSSIGFVECFNQTLLNRLRRMWQEVLRSLQQRWKEQSRYTITHRVP